ncbi:MAG: hypothetical protein WHV67_06995 [Thermoanaerobaculia bacterium]
MEIKINKNQRKELASFLYDLALKFNGQAREEKDKIEISFDLIHRFFKGKVFCEIFLKEKLEEIEISVETKNSQVQLSNAGKGLLFLGTASIIPWVFWWYFPALLPLVSISGIFLILTYLGIGRKPPYLYPAYYEELLKNHFKS